jgi:hypothetical protein
MTQVSLSRSTTWQRPKGFDMRIHRANIRREALCYRIWAYANPLGWDVNVTDLAQELDVSHQRVGAALKAKGWTNRIRVDRNWNGYPRTMGQVEDMANV